MQWYAKEALELLISLLEADHTCKKAQLQESREKKELQGVFLERGSCGQVSGFNLSFQPLFTRLGSG
jgi:hypothetical protein